MQADDKIATVFMANAMVNASKFSRGIYALVVEAIRAADGEADADGQPAEHPHDAQEGPALEPYLGTYDSQPWGGETAVVQWKGGLATLTLPTDNPAQALSQMRHDEGDVFYRVRPDGTRGEDVIFQRDENGVVVSFTRHGNYSRRIR